MLEIKRANLPVNESEEGSVIAEVDVHFSGGLSKRNAEDAGEGALIVASADEMDPRDVHTALQNGGHSTVRARDRFLQPVPINRRFDNSLQKMPDGTSIQMSEIKNWRQPIDSEERLLVSPLAEGISRRVVMNVFTPSTRPEDFGIRVLPNNKDLKKAA